ncbi:MAG TPA: tRNA (adenosine(37)-N6)-threonylcarbamoyltransferase complex dimerization subunit type 1 TsaB, partial [Stellaceae bacterium]|nr:tRNA (adenosine(37)-N6)-threonylcarbamoyltransferase complex dimerization subunit type 1 TsaB [Stellaceae bacterium]
MHDPVTPAAQRGAHNPAALLAIDTAGSGCSAAVARGATVLAAERQALRHGHAEVLLPMIDRVVAASGVAREQIGIVAAAVGPGGFTGIRVGLAAASGIALALGARPIGVTSFAAVAAAAARQVDPACSPLLVALDSRRAELYVQLFALTTRNKSAVPLDAPQALPPDRLADYLAGRIGRGAAPLLAGDAAEAA